MQFDINRMKRSDQVIAVCGAVLFICLFLPFFHVSFGGYSASGSGHQVGFLAWAGLMLGFLAGGLGFFPSLGVAWPAQAPVTRTITTLGVSALATLLIVLKLLIGYHGLSRSFGLYVAVVAVVVQLVFALLAFRESGEALPTRASFSGLGGGASGSGGGNPGPGAPGNTPPPAG